MNSINLAERLDGITDRWNPRIVADINGMHVKLAKIEGEFIWHHHEVEDEMFLVLKGELLMQFRDGEVRVGPGEMIVVPAGVEHRPVGIGEVHLMLVEPATTLNTGNVRDDRTRTDLERI